MNISFIPAVRPVNINNQSTKLSFKSSMPEDTFVKTTENKEVNQKDKSIEDLLNQIDFIEKDLHEIIKDPKNQIGHGNHSVVYKIPDNDNFVIKVPIYFPVEKIEKFKLAGNIENDKYKINIGQPLASINCRDCNDMFRGNISILKKQNGFSLGVPPYKALSDELGNMREGELPYEHPLRLEHYEKSLSKLANMPVSTYTNLISEIQDAAQYNLYLDHYNTNNLMLDEENQTIGLIDMDEIQNNDINWGNVLYSLTNIVYYNTYKNANPRGNEKGNMADNNTIRIIDKFFEAMKIKGVKIKANERSPEFSSLISSIPFNMYLFQKEGSNNIQTLFLNENQKLEKLKEMGVMEE